MVVGECVTAVTWLVYVLVCVRLHVCVCVCVCVCDQLAQISPRLLFIDAFFNCFGVLVSVQVEHRLYVCLVLRCSSTHPCCV